MTTDAARGRWQHRRAQPNSRLVVHNIMLLFLYAYLLTLSGWSSGDATGQTKVSVRNSDDNNLLLYNKICFPQSDRIRVHGGRTVL